MARLISFWRPITGSNLFFWAQSGEIDTEKLQAGGPLAGHCPLAANEAIIFAQILRQPLLTKQALNDRRQPGNIDAHVGKQAGRLRLILVQNAQKNMFGATDLLVILMGDALAVAQGCLSRLAELFFGWARLADQAWVWATD